MRTTLAIDDDVLAVVRERAARQHQSVGAVLSALAREALHPIVWSSRLISSNHFRIRILPDFLAWSKPVVSH